MVSTRLLKNLSKDLNKSSTFKDYRIWPNALLKINQTKTIATIQATCNSFKKKDSETRIQKFLLNNIRIHCANKYLRHLTSVHFNSYRFHRKFMTYFQNNIGLFLHRNNIDELKYFLSRFKRNSPKHKLFSYAVTDHLMRIKAPPKRDLVKYLSINPQITRFIQSVELDQYATKNIFWKEFNKLTEKARLIADEKESKEKIAQAIDHSLNYFNSTLEYQSRPKIFSSMLSLAKSMMRRDEHKLARKCYRRLLQENDIDFNKVFFEYVWTHITEGDYDEVLKAAKKYIKPHHKVLDNSKLSFWLGYSHLKEGNDEEAEQLFRSTVKENPLSYYAILSSKLLAEEEDDKDTEALYFAILKKHNANRGPLSDIKLDDKWVKRVLAWSYAGNSQLLNNEFRHINESRAGRDLETHILTAAYKLSENKHFLESFKLIYRSVDQDKISVNKDTLKILFPLPYLNQIKRNTKEFDPIIALSLIRQESGFNRHARSHVGARGLMQLMPNTAKRIKRRVRTRQLYNANLNINIGTKFFNKLLNRYDNNLVYSLAAYNAGQRRIDDWQERNYVNSSATMLNNIENIPFLETRKYVKLIFRNIFFYKMLLSSDQVVDTEKFNKIYDINVGFNK